MGAVTQPWLPNPVFRGLPPEEFAAFAEPGYVKIIWNLRADPIAPVHSIARTETRAVATDRKARVAFRRYWPFVSPGVWLIRELGLHLSRRTPKGVTGAGRPDARRVEAAATMNVEPFIHHHYSTSVGESPIAHRSPF